MKFLQLKKTSIVIPCYNHAAYIEDAVNSAVSQTYSNKEIIVIDDGSNDETKKVLKRLEPKIDILITQENQGVVAARNNAIQKASGEYILTLDADDYFENSFLEKAVSILDAQPRMGMVTCWASILNEKGEQTRISKPTGADAFAGLFRNNASASLLLRKKCWEEVNGYDNRMNKGFEDWEFTIAVGKRGWEIEVIPEKLFNYRNIPNSRNKNARSSYAELRAYVYKKHKSLLARNIEETIDHFLEEIESKNIEIRKLRTSRSYRIWKTYKQIHTKINNIFGR